MNLRNALYPSWKPLARTGLLFALVILLLASLVGCVRRTHPTDRALPSGQEQPAQWVTPAQQGSTGTPVFAQPILTPTLTSTPTPPGWTYLPLIVGAGKTTPRPGDVQIQISPPPYQLGSTLNVIVYPGRYGMAYYELYVADHNASGAPQPQPLVRVTFENQVTLLEGASQVLEVVSARGSLERAEFALRVKGEGSTILWVNVTGETWDTPGGPFYFSGGSSPQVTIDTAVTPTSPAAPITPSAVNNAPPSQDNIPAFTVVQSTAADIKIKMKANFQVPGWLMVRETHVMDPKTDFSLIPLPGGATPGYQVEETWIQIDNDQKVKLSVTLEKNPQGAMLRTYAKDTYFSHLPDISLDGGLLDRMLTPELASQYQVSIEEYQGHQVYKVYSETIPQKPYTVPGYEKKVVKSYSTVYFDLLTGQPLSRSFFEAFEDGSIRMVYVDTIEVITGQSLPAEVQAVLGHLE